LTTAADPEPRTRIPHPNPDTIDHVPVTLAAVEEARRNIAAIALRTPTVRLNADPEVYLKLENLQPIGSFARRMGVPATVVSPDTAPQTKIRAVERLGGRVILAPFEHWWRTFETRSYPGVDATFIHAFDDPDVMAGNGTIALELLEDLGNFDAVIIPWGGGGLSCGIASVLRERAPHVRIYAAEVSTAAPLAASLAAREPRMVDYTPSFVDGIGSRMVFPGMFQLARTLLEGSLVVSLDEAAAAMKLVAERNRVIIEGASACAVAAAVAGKAGAGRVVAIVSGGNIDLSKFAELTAS